MDIFAYYSPKDFNERDAEAKRVAEPFTTRWIGSGTMLATGERDLQWELKPGCDEIAEAALKRAGFRTRLWDREAAIALQNSTPST